MKFLFVLVTIFILISCDDGITKSDIKDICNSRCENYSCYEDNSLKIKECKDRCIGLTYPDCMDNCRSLKKYNEYECKAYCDARDICNEKKYKKCINEIYEANICFNDCVRYENSCSDEEYCINNGDCDKIFENSMDCVFSIEECNYQLE
ncbi:hypothetical protein JXR93_11520 [bacterium]|nr:hypothetical protein [bacterium]